MSLSNCPTFPELPDVLRAHTKLLVENLVRVFAQLRSCPLCCTCTCPIILNYTCESLCKDQRCFEKQQGKMVMSVP